MTSRYDEYETTMKVLYKIIYIIQKWIAQQREMIELEKSEEIDLINTMYLNYSLKVFYEYFNS